MFASDSLRKSIRLVRSALVSLFSPLDRSIGRAVGPLLFLSKSPAATMVSNFLTRASCSL